MQILFLNGNEELVIEDWPYVPRVGDKVQIQSRNNEINGWHVKSVIWKKDFVRIHVTKDRR